MSCCGSSFWNMKICWFFSFINFSNSDLFVVVRTLGWKRTFWRCHFAFWVILSVLKCCSCSMLTSSCCEEVFILQIFQVFYVSEPTFNADNKRSPWFCDVLLQREATDLFSPSVSATRAVTSFFLISFIDLLLRRHTKKNKPIQSIPLICMLQQLHKVISHHTHAQIAPY